MSYYSVLRIGPLVDENAALLRSAISSHFKVSSPHVSDSSATEDQLTISNRYFDASVLLKDLNESISLPTNDELIQEDGIILIFDTSKAAPVSQTFDHLSHHHESAIQANRAGELLRLCVGASFGPSPLCDGSKKSEEEYSRRVLWCLDRGYEYVEVDLSEDGMKRGHDERDKEGFARIIEAVSTCMWSSRVMKPRDGVSQVEKSAENTSKRIKQTEQADKYDSAVNNNDESREAVAMASLMNDLDEEQSQQASQKENENRQHELAFHQLEQVINEAKQIREASQSDTISDDERRQRAGDTAVKLMGLLEKFGFDDEEDDDDDDEAVLK